jgi:hypothetical protein
MPTQHGIQDGPADTRRISPVAFLLLTERIVREARTAQAAAIGDAVAAAIVAAIRAVRLLPSVFRDAFVLRDTLMPARQRSRTRHHNHAQ